ncbi:hypothetical protein TNCT_686421 [Trichonephila clavata]|uniref:Uncharacterized protein n=1 Tax=Trichonephila clavata TaxID=2740835 RepID=A0A8X6J4G4_TRICU|nr:hypothetical protein TNCT_686421 [Trichonephila clavata]
MAPVNTEHRVQAMKSKAVMGDGWRSRAVGHDESWWADQTTSVNFSILFSRKMVIQMDSCSGRRGNMTSIDNGSWSERTDVSTSPSTMGLGAHCDSPSRKSFGDDYIVEHSDVFREAIKSRNRAIHS